MEKPNNVQVPEVLDLFHVPPERCGIQDVRFIEYQPISAVNFSNPIEFQIPGSGDQYIDLSRTYLYLKVKVEKKGGGTEAADKMNISTTNAWLHSLFEGVEIQLQQKVLFNTSKMYGYKSILECLTSLTPGGEKALTKEMFHRDTPYFMDNMDPKDPGNMNIGYYQRSGFIANGRECEMFGRLHHDFAQMKRPVILNGVSVGVKLQPASKRFCLLSISPDADKYEIHILAARLRVCKVQLARELFLAHSQVLAKNHQAIYPVNKTEMTSYVLQKGTSYWAQSDIFQNRIPHYMVIAFTSSEAFDGSFQRNPFNFHHFDLSSLTVFRDGQVVPHKAIECNYEKSQYIEAYNSFYETDAAGGAITLKEFGGGYSIYVFRLDDSIYDSHCTPPKTTGNLTVEARFSKSLRENVQAVILAKFQEVVKIDQYRNVTP